MNPPSVPPAPIAVDPAYHVRDNQFWYTNCAFAGLLSGATTITLHIAGLGVRVLTRAAQGNNPIPTTSFRLPSAADREWWEGHRGQLVRVELLAVGATVSTPVPSLPPVVPTLPPAPVPAPTTPSQAAPGTQRSSYGAGAAVAGSVLCIGLDVAWFGGSAADRDSQYDCLAWTLLDRRADQPLTIVSHLERVPLQNRDPDASQLLREIGTLLERYGSVEQVVFALDAPVQAAPRSHLTARLANAPAGSIERRACENHLSHNRQRIDALTGGAGDWYPNIQPGAPLAPRVLELLAGLDRLGFRLWTDAEHASARLVIECFPAEAIWAMKRLGRYDAALTGTQVKSYKAQEGSRLTARQVTTLVHTVLGGFATDSGCAGLWTILVEHAIEWMLADATWRTAADLYRGGKPLDDVVDSMICLATSMSYVHGQFHVWQDPGQPIDGYIIGPGRLGHLLPGPDGGNCGALQGQTAASPPSQGGT